MTLRSKDTTPIQRFDSRSRSRPRGKDRGNHQACPEGTPRCLCRKLEELYETGRLTLYRGTVSQTRLVEQLQLPKGVLVNRHRQKSAPGRCVSRFDRLLESWGHGTVWEEKIPQIRQLLEEHKTAGALPVNEQGDLNRTAILREFGLKDASTHVVQKRAPKLRALLDAYDTTRDDPAYTPYKYDALETRLKRVLTSEELKLTHGRIVSREWIAEKLKVKPGALASTPKLNELIEQKQREIDKQLRRGRTKKAFRIGRTEHINLGATPYSDKHERVFDFSGLVPDYGLEYAEKVGTVFIAVSESLVAPKAHYHRMRHFLGWLANRPSGDITERLRRGEAVGRGEFERAALLYKAELTDEMAKGRGDRRRAHPLLSIIERSGEAGLFPRVRFPKAPRGRQRQAGTPRPSLVEARSLDTETSEVLQSARYRDIELGAGRDAIAFDKTLARERAARDDLPSALPEAIRVLCEERLVELRRTGSRVFEAWRKKYETGRSLIESADATGEEIFKSLQEGRKAGLFSVRWRKLVAATFPKAEPERALANMLAVVEARFDGICPPGTKGEWGSFWVAQYRKMGGLPEIQAHLVPPRVVVSATVILYLCESGANSEVALGMRQNAIRKSETPRHLTVVGRKGRSGNQPIFSELPMRSTANGCTSAAEALLFFQEAVRTARPADRQTPLFVHVARGTMRALEEWQLRNDMETIRRESESLVSFQIFPSMLRATVLLALQLRHPNNPGIVQMLAGHRSDTTTNRYVNKLPYRMILDDRIRTFTDTIEVVISDEKTWKRMGRTDGQWREALAKAQRTGLGVYCADPHAGAQREFPKGTTCEALDRCLTCSKILVIADRDSVADMIVWRKGLEAAEQACLDDRTERWEQKWVPWQAFFQVVLDEKMARGELLVIRREGEQEVMKRMARPGFSLPKPW